MDEAKLSLDGMLSGFKSFIKGLPGIISIIKVKILRKPLKSGDLNKIKKMVKEAQKLERDLQLLEKKALASNESYEPIDEYMPGMMLPFAGAAPAFGSGGYNGGGRKAKGMNSSAAALTILIGVLKAAPDVANGIQALKTGRRMSSKQLRAIQFASRQISGFARFGKALVQDEESDRRYEGYDLELIHKHLTIKLMEEIRKTQDHLYEDGTAAVAAPAIATIAAGNVMAGSSADQNGVIPRGGVPKRIMNLKASRELRRAHDILGSV